MKDVIVVSAITERRHMIDEYEDQLAAAGIDFHLEPIKLDNGIASITARWRFGFIRAMCERFKSYRRIIFTDAWDVLFFGTKEDLLGKISPFPLVSAERNCWPEENLVDRIPDNGPWRYVNAGMFCGKPSVILGWIEDALRTPDLDMMDQAWFNRRLANRDFAIIPDYRTSIFYTVSYDREDGSLHKRLRGPCNYAYGTYPQFFHFAGPCSSVPFRAMLRTGEPLCASV